jgi:nicotinamidase-related amidase
MSFNTLSPSKSGVVFFDMLNAGFRGRPEADQRRMEPIVANCVRLRDAAHLHDVALFYPKADHRPDGKDIAAPYIDLSPRMVPWDDPEDTRRPHATNVAGNWGAQVIDELEPTDDDYVIPKHRWSSFFQTKLELSMRSRGIDTLILCGGSTEVGIASTTYAARDLDFDLVFVSDAITSGKPDVNEMFMTRIFPRMGRVRDTSQVIEMIAAGTAAGD